MSEKSVETIGKPYETFVKAVGKGVQPDTGNAVYAIAVGGKLIRTTYHTCFGKLNHYEDEFGDDPPDALLIQVQSPLTTNFERYAIYYEWLFHYSPWRSVFITKDVSRMLKDRAIAVDTDVNRNLMAGGAIACRHPWESFSTWGNHIRVKVELWLALVEQGNDPTLSFVFANQLSCQGAASYETFDLKQTKEKMWFIDTHSVGHQSLSAYAHVKNSHANFIQEIVKEDSTYRDVMSYEGPNDVWLKSRKKPDHFYKFLKDNMAGSKKNSNPFGGAGDAVDKFKWNYVLGRLKELMPEWAASVKEA